LLAQKVLKNETRGYRQHPQLVRFRQHADSLGAIASYLQTVADEAAVRGYRFDREKIAAADVQSSLVVTSGQLDYERSHLLAKLQVRDRLRYEVLLKVSVPEPHPLFRVVPGDVEPWEVVPER
jgi:hypothetical protein